MIKLIDNTLPSLQSAGSFVGIKILANYLAYGTKYSFCTFWVQTSEGNPTAIINKYENTVFIQSQNNADFGELKEFCDMIGYLYIQSDINTLNQIGLNNINKYAVLCKETAEMPNSHITYNAVNLKEVYGILFFEPSEILSKPDFDGWYADMSHRIRHKIALALENQKGALVFSHITDTSAIISGIAVLPTERKNGVGTKLLSKGINSVSGRKVFACTDSATTDFYLKNGFIQTEMLGIYTSKEE